ncbi:MAG TPA: hypothetical protein VLQ93_15615 [Myxococcaceae bacterium]|nr:hypothetical protein [Myxococcaceae bacterium]
MSNHPTTVNHLPEPPVVTLFLKPSFGITVQSHTLAVSVRANPEGARPARPPALG